MTLRPSCLTLLVSLGLYGCGDDSSTPADGSSTGSETSTTVMDTPPPTTSTTTMGSTSTGPLDSSSGPPDDTTTTGSSSGGSSSGGSSSGGSSSGGSSSGGSSSGGSSSGGSSSGGSSSGGSSSGGSSSGGSTAGDPCDAGDDLDYMVGNLGFGDYTFNGVPDPTINVVRGCSYNFDVDTPGHPFLIKSVQGVGVGNAYNDGVVNNGVSSGLITWTVPMAAPNTLFYNCQFHGMMTGEFNVIDPM